ncbi:MAG: ATP synthase subunit C [Defluviitaleaceae bacterium]|nr:ATP synthase subunit C [Defluviitaleaceae bacterium]
MESLGFYFLLMVIPPMASIFLYRLGVRTKRTLIFNIASFSLLFIWVTFHLFSVPVQAAQTDGTIANPALSAALIGAGVATGLACVGAGIATGSAASAAIGAVSENENMMGKALIFVAMAEGIAIYGLLIAFMILNRA